MDMIIAFLVVGFAIGACLGYLLNIIRLVIAGFNRNMAEVIIRVLGLIVTPLGCILGFISFAETSD